MKTVVRAFFLVLFSINLFAQSVNSIDSLEKKLETEHEISNRIDLYIALSQEYVNLDIDRSISVAGQALTLASNIDNDKAIGTLNMLLGDFNLLKDRVELAEEYYKTALPFLERAHLYKELIKTNIALGNRFNEKDNYPEAMNQYLSGIRYSEREKITVYLPRLYNNLGVVYLKLNNPEKAVELYSSALKLFKENGDSSNVAGTTTNIGSIYLELGDFENAKKYYLEGLQLFNSIHHKGGQAHALFKLGLLDNQLKEYKSALLYLTKSLEIQNSMDVSMVSKKMFLSETFVNMGIIYLAIGDDPQAEHYLKEGYNLASQTMQNTLIALAAENLSKYYKKNKKFERSLNYYEVFKQYSDSTFNEENVKNITRIEMNHQFDEKLRDTELTQLVAEQKRKRINMIYLVVSVGLLLVLTIVFLLLLLEKGKKKKVELEKERLSVKLEYTNKELTTHVMYLLRKNEFILSIIEKLKVARLDAKPENKKVIADLISELKSNTDTVSWEEFEVRFQEVHIDFYSNIRQKFPDLSTNEIRLCAFFRLNMTSKEIAAITYQSLNSIKVARYRLRKKLTLSKDENLIKFLSQF